MDGENNVVMMMSIFLLNYIRLLFSHDSVGVVVMFMGAVVEEFESRLS